ncbi:dTDP-4-dehydrorhamnose reductase [Methylotenera sp.]|uniref:dTDP-4-dehydrorhamnose reductase n=1 Tax=Methylotenera sp. TaxID=2051956 RepID=UPI002488BACC|nr:dTDP-4-dehydrorhamnose reductase [Methylotenera sp.]MDI1298764.1 dTDP-4-dehydrorhamnose reductase [Methylotenera sp.]
MKILLLGKNGQVGWELQRSLAVLGEVVALGTDSTDYCGDFTNLQGLADTVDQVRPDYIVNAAAYTAVDKAESEPELARLVNALAPEVLAKAAEKIGACFVHYSTDYVFDGGGEQPWVESDIQKPLNIYGQTKLEGEQLIAAACTQYLIFRTSWVYAARGANFAKTMLRLAKERDRLTVISDQFGAPTGAELLADSTSHAIRSIESNPKLSGIYHLAASGETTWYGYAKFVINQAQQAGAVLKVNVDAIDPVLTSAFPTPATRPYNSRLNTTKFKNAFNLELPNWQQGVARMLNEIL